MANRASSDNRARGLILAAGRGTRFAGEPGSVFPKVMRPLLGRPMVNYVLDALRGAGVEDITVVVGCAGDQVTQALGEDYSFVIQPEQNGSGDAARWARDRFRGVTGALVVMCGDSPLFCSQTIREMIRIHSDLAASVTLASALLEDPTGYGRILRGREGAIEGVVEQKCATPVQRAIREVNGGAYVFDTRWLFDNVDLMAENAGGEYNLTDMVRVAVEQGRTVASVGCKSEEIGGVNTPSELQDAETILRRREAR